MKNIIVGIAVLAFTISACNTNKDDASTTVSKTSDTTVAASTTAAPVISADTSIQDMVGQYLVMKNALAGDNSKDAASAGNAFVAAMGKLNQTSLSADKKKTWDEVADDAKEHAQHIGDNADKIAHQREHFDMLSKDMYEMVKVFGTDQTLYKTFCPMYNDKKGAIWLSEVKAIKNPYYGKEMLTCGSVKEEIK